ncbi:MAG: phosphohistidine phosphatase SixA [Pseudomonadota bacterium]
MAIFLVQHGKALSKDVDLQRSLSEEGKQETHKIASILKSQEITISKIYHSGKKRAQETAELFASAVGSDVEKMDGLSPDDDVAAIAQKLDPSANIMIVGHLPFMKRLVSYLIAGNIDKPIIKFQNSGVVCLDKDDDGDWIIRWAVVPKQ